MESPLNRSAVLERKTLAEVSGEGGGEQRNENEKRTRTEMRVHRLSLRSPL
jgi:hypothetical protein